MDSIDQSRLPNAQQAADDLLSFDLLETLPPLTSEGGSQGLPAAASPPQDPSERDRLNPEEELLRDLFPEEAHGTDVEAATISEGSHAHFARANQLPEESREAPQAVEALPAPAAVEPASAELSSQAYVSLRSLEGLEELEDVAPPPVPAVRPHVESAAQVGPYAAEHRELSATERTLIHLTRSVEQLTAIVFQMNGTIQLLSQGLHTGQATFPVPSASPHLSGFSADPADRFGQQAAVAPQAAPAPVRRSWEPAATPPPRETPEQWSERLEKFFDEPMPAPVETVGDADAQESARKLACDVLNALNSHNMKSLEVRVEEGGVVVLKGRVISENLRYLATIVAQRTAGCQRVVNELVVSAEPEPSSMIGRYWKHRTPGQKRLHLVAAVAVLLLSCSGYWIKEWLRPSVVAATGIVDIEGQPVDGARLVLHPVLLPGQSPRDVRYPIAVTDGQGKFDFTTYKPHDGIPPGEYHVSIEWRRLVEIDEEVAPGPNLLPAHYLNPQASGIRVKIARDTRELPPITLKW